MRTVVRGVAAAEGRALGVACRLEWDIPRVKHRTIRPDEVESELRRFDRARQNAVRQVHEVRRATANQIGELEARVFESQALMIDDPDLVEGTGAYIRDNFLSAERAFDWQTMELRLHMLDSGHAMVIDRLADLRDIRLRVLADLLGRPLPTLDFSDRPGPVIVVADEISPSLAVEFDPKRVHGFVTAGGSRGSHSVLLARALGIPGVVAVGAEISNLEDGQLLLVDGTRGEITAEPAESELESFRAAVETRRERRERLSTQADRPVVTADGVAVQMLANLDQPGEAAEAKRLGARGVGLLRTEFLVIGRRAIPDEESQYRAYRGVVETFPDSEVTLRTFDIGGDKFPLFLSMPQEENPYLGWRAIRVCLDMPELFDNQLRAALRAGAGGKLRLMLPLVVDVDEVRRARDRMHTLAEELGTGGSVSLGIMVETPAAVETLELLAPHIDFVSLGTNDLTQYTLAVDRGNAHLAWMYEPLHPALIRAYGRVAEACRRHEIDLGVCGELAADPAGVCLLMGLGYRKLSVSLAALPDVSDLLSHVSVCELEELCGELLGEEDGAAVRSVLERYVARIMAEFEVPSGGLSKP